MVKVKGMELTDRQYIALLRLYSNCAIGTEVSEKNLIWVKEVF